MPLRLKATEIHYQALRVKAYIALIFTFSHQVLNMSVNIVLKRSL